MRNFAVTGVAGFVARRHLEAIKAVGGRLVAAVDPHDAVGLLDQYSFDVRFFTEFERFDRHLEKLRRGPEAERVNYVSICSPNYLHDAHIRLALRVGADAICEKPLVINPWNLAPLQELERETGRRIYTVLQLRLHPTLVRLRRDVLEGSKRLDDVRLTYVTARGRWYRQSWKGSEERSGGLVCNIGVHLFDLLLWLFGEVRDVQVHRREPGRAAGLLELERAGVQWFLSTERDDLPFPAEPGGRTTYRSLLIDGKEIEFTHGFTDLHSRVYEEVLGGRGCGIDDARPSIELVHRIREAAISAPSGRHHPLLSRSAPSAETGRVR